MAGAVERATDLRRATPPPLLRQAVIRRKLSGMTRPVLPDGIRRVPISVSLSPGVIALVDQMIADGEASTRSRAVEQAITFWAGTPAPSPKRKARK